MILDYITNILDIAIKESGFKIDYPFQIELSEEGRFGDITSNVALVNAKLLNINPIEFANQILKKLNYDHNIISKVEIAGPGFINFYLSENLIEKNINDILTTGNNYGKTTHFQGKRANVEWVSANPTGPLHAGHGRQVALGKAIVNLLEAIGYQVDKEYYYNDAGSQMKNLAISVYARYMQIFDKNYPFPEDGYFGDYITQIAKQIYDQYKNTFFNNFDFEFFKSFAEQYNFNSIKSTLEKLGIKFDQYFSETSLYKSGEINNLLKYYKEKGLSYEKDGAVWLKMDVNNFKSDKVIVKKTGEPTYRLPDIAYHINKIKRGYDLIVDIFGSDHSDTYKEVLYGVSSAGYNVSHIKVIIHQMVTFKKGERTVKLSKRSGESFTLDELIEEIGTDATQFFFVMRAPSTHLDFDIELAKQTSEKNPVYYLQYAHARICGIIRNANNYSSELTVKFTEQIPLHLLKNEDEKQLMKILFYYPYEVYKSAINFEPHKIISYLNLVAENFHRFYHNNRVLDSENIELSKARLSLSLATKIVLSNGLNIIGVTAPERM
jgi:arginyl-tRNA synthetase